MYKIEMWSAAALGLVLIAPHSTVLAAGSPTQTEPANERASIPIACTLSSDEKRERKEGAETELFATLDRVTELENGYTLWFPREDGQLDKIALFVELESQCCAFLDFEIRVEAGGEDIAVDLTGPEGTKEILQPLVYAFKGTRGDA